MKTLRVAIIVGTRPEVIKMSPVYLKMKSNPAIETVLITTAQHRQMLDHALASFQIKPDFDLNIMQPDQTLTDLAAGIITNVQIALSKIKPDVVLVHGDTSTCLYSALAAFYESIPVGHVEAGLRTYNNNAPWPEEINRRLTDPICEWCFAPTKSAAANLIAESVPVSKIHITGNTGVDALLLAKETMENRHIFIKGLDQHALIDKRTILVTGHRRESFGKEFENLCFALRNIVDTHKSTAIVYPVHLNPNIQKPVKKILGNQSRIFLIEPVNYLQFIYLMNKCEIIITDSGGVQEEAPSLHKPVLITRQITERPEAVEECLAKLVGTSSDNILPVVSKLLSDTKFYDSMTHGPNPYGDGKASERIIDILLSSITSC